MVRIAFGKQRLAISRMEFDISIVISLTNRLLSSSMRISASVTASAATLYEHYDEVLNFFVNRATNAFAESFNAKIKAFRAALRGVTDIKFFLFRLTKLYA